MSSCVRPVSFRRSFGGRLRAPRGRQKSSQDAEFALREGSVRGNVRGAVVQVLPRNVEPQEVFNGKAAPPQDLGRQAISSFPSS
eukprot:6338036-Pyramimonas_sp.AAC.1